LLMLGRACAMLLANISGWASNAYRPTIGVPATFIIL
jgi:hypothetical protein